jgi:DNA-binding transcriptional MerR regulator
VIRRLRDLGMPLDQITAVVHARDVDTRNAAIAAHLRRMEDQLEETRATVASLRALIERGPATIGVEYRRLPQAPTIAIGEEVRGAEMHAWLDEAFAVTGRHAQARQGHLGQHALIRSQTQQLVRLL